MKKILGLDLGTNSIGWAVVNAQDNLSDGVQINDIVAAGSRIIPMDAAILGNFNKGNSVSQTADRTNFRGVRRLRERFLLRRERLHRVLRVMNFLPEHYLNDIDRYGKFINFTEPKIPWKKLLDNKYEFIFKTSFEEMLNEFKEKLPYLVENGKKVPYDWTLYYLRKKALSAKISKEELSWILLNANQKRGYYQLRGEDEEDDKKQLVEFYALKVVDVQDSGDKKGKDTWYNIVLENGWIYRRTSSGPLNWIGKIKEFIVTTSLDDDGEPKKNQDGEIKRSFRAPKEDDWTLIKKKTETDLENSGKYVGEYIFDTLLNSPVQKIRGKLISTIERKYYKAELYKILQTQKTFYPELNDSSLYKACLEELYPNNPGHVSASINKDFTNLFVNDIILYQRPLKIKKSLISDCPYEERIYIDKETKERHKVSIKCIAKSHPVFQEFRLWQFISNIRIYEREKIIDGKTCFDVDITNNFLRTEEDYVNLYYWLNDRKDINQKIFLSYPEFGFKKNAVNYRWNYIEDDSKLYPCNKTRNAILSKLDKKGERGKLTSELELKIWHLLYSINSQQEINQVFTEKGRIAGIYKELQSIFSEESIQKIKNVKLEETDYGSYSYKAINRLLPLMRMGYLWNEDKIDIHTKERIDKILYGEYDPKIRERVREKAINLKSISDFKGLPLWLACYVVYDRHSEAKEITKWETPEDIDSYIKSFKQHSLRNPIVEQVVTETLRVVRDIWKQVGSIDEIHIELGREMKNPADKRARITKQIIDNENANLRIKALLSEFINPEFGVANVIPYSPSQQEILRIYEEGVFDGVTDIPEDIEEILKKFNESDPSKRPTNSDVKKYKLWLEQKYISPYTGEIIPLGKLFTTAYEIEHIIPQSRYFDDSFGNKVICEAEVNRLKSNMLGYEFIKEHGGEKVEIGGGRSVKLLTIEEYESIVKKSFYSNKNKMGKLLMEDIPDNFIERQLNDSRYISKVVKSLLSNIVRVKDINGEYEQEAVSKNLISCTGGITDKLKKDWGLNDVWNSIIINRFIRLNEINGNQSYTSVSKEGHIIPSMPLELQKGFNKKRIDHRHHAMDAIVIACATRNHINLLNNECAKSDNKTNRYQLSRKLRHYEKIEIYKGGEKKIIDVAKEFIKPWETFTQDVKSVLENIIVSFKQNLRVVNKTSNYYQKIENGNKIYVKQNDGNNVAIRKSMHKDTVYGEVNLQKVKQIALKEAIETPQFIVNKELKIKIKELLNSSMDEKQIKKYFEANKDTWDDVNISKIDVFYYTKETNDKYYASRKPIDDSFTKDSINAKVTDYSIQKILLAHLALSDNNPKFAFSPEGIEQMNENIVSLNGGKLHKPISKVRIYEKGEKFPVGQSGTKLSKYVEAAKGTNLFYAVYQKEIIDKKTGENRFIREYETIPLSDVIDRKKKREVIAENTENRRLLFILSPNDLVYLPTQEELVSGVINKPINRKRVYKMVSCTGNVSDFIPSFIANPILDNKELGSNNKAQRSWSGEMIKEICIPLKVDRLGNILNI